MFAKITPITWYGSKGRSINNVEELFKTNKHYDADKVYIIIPEGSRYYIYELLDN